MSWWRNRRPEPLLHVCGCGAAFDTREERREHMRTDCPNRHVPHLSHGGHPLHIDPRTGDGHVFHRAYRQDFQQARRYLLEGDECPTCGRIIDSDAPS